MVGMVYEDAGEIYLLHHTQRKDVMVVTMKVINIMCRINAELMYIAK